MVPQERVYSVKLAPRESAADGLKRLLLLMGDNTRFFKARNRILLKPNFVAPFSGVTTDLAIIDGLVKKIREAGAIPFIAESSGFEFDTESTFKILGIDAYARKNDIELINLDHEDFQRISWGKSGKYWEVSRRIFTCDGIINLPVLKRHSVTVLSGAVKNLMGFLSRNSRRFLHCRNLEEGLVFLSKSLPSMLHIVDARTVFSRAVFGTSGNLGYLFGGMNPFALDRAGASAMGLNPACIPHLQPAVPFEIKGESLPALSLSKNASKRTKNFFPFFYRAAYCLDLLKVKIIGGNSIIPNLHWTFGLHPVLKTKNECELRRVASLCPVGAVSMEKKKIIKKKCQCVRCLRCCQEAEDIVGLRGFHPPG
ncbi:MAG: DUF362 domain-containing protein [Candidatus Aminicenantes bacterium]|nr:DUF362 domain-containing protein [Candidatus Aminicenantes bacterium]